MFKCFSSNNTQLNQDELLNKIRTLNTEAISIDLSEYKLSFNEKTGDWKSKSFDKISEL
jgi:hypothetical protein